MLQGQLTNLCGWEEISSHVLSPFQEDSEECLTDRDDGLMRIILLCVLERITWMIRIVFHDKII